MGAPSSPIAAAMPSADVAGPRETGSGDSAVVEVAPASAAVTSTVPDGERAGVLAEALFIVLLAAGVLLAALPDVIASGASAAERTSVSEPTAGL